MYINVRISPWFPHDFHVVIPDPMQIGKSQGLMETLKRLKASPQAPEAMVPCDMGQTW